MSGLPCASLWRMHASRKTVRETLHDKGLRGMAHLNNVVREESCNQFFLAMQHSSKTDDTEYIVENREIKDRIHWTFKAEGPFCKFITLIINAANYTGPMQR